MTSIRTIADNRPYLFVLGLFFVQLVSAFPFVAVFKVLELDLVPLRVILPIFHSALMIWIIWYLGWFQRAGFSTTVRNVHLYWYPVALAFVPVLAVGSIAIPTQWIIFYSAALVFTGISEEAYARGLFLPALLPKGRWVALIVAAALFSVGHFTNLFFEDFGILEMSEKLLSTFGFAVLYGAVFLRTGNIWPLMFLHTIHDYMFLTSGTAGPFTVAPLPLEFSFALAVANITYAAFIVSRSGA